MNDNIDNDKIRLRYLVFMTTCDTRQAIEVEVIACNENEAGEKALEQYEDAALDYCEILGVA